MTIYAEGLMLDGLRLGELRGEASKMRLGLLVERAKDGPDEIRTIVTMAGPPAVTGPSARMRHQALRLAEQGFARRLDEVFKADAGHG